MITHRMIEDALGNREFVTKFPEFTYKQPPRRTGCRSCPGESGPMRASFTHTLSTMPDSRVEEVVKYLGATNVYIARPTGNGGAKWEIFNKVD